MRIWAVLVLLLLAGCAAPEAELDHIGPTPTSLAPSPTASPTSPRTNPDPTPGPDPTAAPSPTDAPDPSDGRWEPAWGDDDAPLYPGAPIGWCTYDFLFFDRAAEAYYIGTAGHCTEEIGEQVPLVGHGDIGTVVFDSDVTPGAADIDFTLIELDEGWNLKATPRMKNTDGPTGVAGPSDTALGDELLHHGYALVLGDTEPTRDRSTFLLSHGKEYCSEGPVWWGDSGGPVLHGPSGKALGIVSRAGWIECIPYAGAQLMGATVAWILEEMERHGFALELAIVA